MVVTKSGRGRRRAGKEKRRRKVEVVHLALRGKVNAKMRRALAQHPKWVRLREMRREVEELTR